MVKISPISTEVIAETVRGSVVLNRLESGEVLKAAQLGEPLEVGADGVAFVISESYVKDVPGSKAGILVVQAALVEKIMPILPSSVRVVITTADAYLGLAHLSKVVSDAMPYGDWSLCARTEAQIHSSARIDPTAKISTGAYICEGVEIGARTLVLPHAIVGPGVVIGQDCIVFPGVVLYPKTQVGHRVRLHANVVLGSDGFGYARGPQGSVKIWHLGRVVVQDDVEIGSGTTVDRGTIGDTVIERGAKIDNQVQIGHNGYVKAHAILCAQVGMAGNVVIGAGAILAGKVGVADKLEIGDGAIIGPMSGLSKDVKPKEIIMGQQPAKPRREWWKLMALIERLPDLFDRIKKIEKNLGNEKS